MELPTADDYEAVLREMSAECEARRGLNIGLLETLEQIIALHAIPRVLSAVRSGAQAKASNGRYRDGRSPTAEEYRETILELNAAVGDRDADIDDQAGIGDVHASALTWDVLLEIGRRTKARAEARVPPLFRTTNTEAAA